MRTLTPLLKRFAILLILATPFPPAPGHAQNESPEELVADAIRAIGDSNQDTWSRAKTIERLGSLGARAKDAVPYLAKALRDPADYVRFQAAYVLGKIGPDAVAAVPALIEALQAHFAGIRSQACSALTLIGEPARLALPALQSAGGSRSGLPGIRYDASDLREKSSRRLAPPDDPLQGSLSDLRNPKRTHPARRRCGPRHSAALKRRPLWRP